MSFGVQIRKLLEAASSALQTPRSLLLRHLAVSEISKNARCSKGCFARKMSATSARPKRITRQAATCKLQSPVKASAESPYGCVGHEAITNSMSCSHEKYCTIMDPALPLVCGPSLESKGIINFWLLTGLDYKRGGCTSNIHNFRTRLLLRITPLLLGKYVFENNCSHHRYHPRSQYIYKSSAQEPASANLSHVPQAPTKA